MSPQVNVLKRCAWAAALFPCAYEPASAGSVPLVYQIEKSEAEDVGVKEEIHNAQMMESETKANLDKLNGEKTKLKQKYDELYHTYRSTVDNFNGQCKGRPEETPGCASLKSAALERKSTDESKLREMAEENGRLANRLQAASTDGVMAHTRVQKLINYEAQLQAAIARMKSQIAHLCKKAYSTREEMKARCGNVQFDGASSELPQCTTDLCRQYDATHR